MKLEYKFIGWCHDEEENHDKVWGVIYLEARAESHLWGGPRRKCLTFWGRRGKKLQTKIVYENYELAKLIDTKREKKGYESIDKKHLDKVYPEFESDLEKTAVWATLMQ